MEKDIAELRKEIQNLSMQVSILRQDKQELRIQLADANSRIENLLNLIGELDSK